MTCPCPQAPGRQITNPERHAAWHRLVVEQGIPAGLVNAATLHAARGMAGGVGTCVDNRDHPAAPGPTIVADAFEYLAAHWHEYDAVTGGPECRDHTDLAYRVGKRGTGWQLAAMLDAVRALPIPWVIENVESADMPCDLLLCGTEFDLSVVTGEPQRRWLRRHRKFAASFPLYGAGGCQHKGKPVIGVYGTGGGGQMTRGYKANRAEACEVMGMPWATRAGVSQAVPPVFTEHIGRQLLAVVEGRVAA